MSVLIRSACLVGAVALLAIGWCSSPSPILARVLQAHDDRAPPQGAEIQDGRASGYIHLSRSPAAFIGSAFVAWSPTSVLSAAHVFSSGGEWRRQLRTATGAPDVSKMRFHLDTCGRSYDIREVHLYRQGPYRWGEDIALVILTEPVCIAALGAPIRALAPADIERLVTLGDRSVSLHAYQGLKRGAAPFGKLVGYGRVLRRAPEFGGDNLLAVSVSTLRGASGGALISHETGRAATFAMLVAEPQDATLPFNIAVALDRQLETWARTILAESR